MSGFDGTANTLRAWHEEDRTLRRGRYRRAQDRPDTTDALRALLEKLSGGKPTFRPCARILGTSHSALWGPINGKRPPPTLDTLAVFTQRAAEETGICMTLLIDSDGIVSWRFE